MSHEITAVSSSPDDEDPSHREQSRGRATDNNGPKPTRMVYTRMQCLEILSQLPGMIKAGFLQPSEANAIKSTLQAILAEHRHSNRSNNGNTALPVDVLNLVREHPELQSWFEPLMSEEDVRNIMKGSNDGY